MKICVKEKLEEITPHAFEKKVLEREMAKGEPRVGMFYQKNQMKKEDFPLILHIDDVLQHGSMLDIPWKKFRVNE